MTQPTTKVVSVRLEDHDKDAHEAMIGLATEKALEFAKMTGQHPVAGILSMIGALEETIAPMCPDLLVKLTEARADLFRARERGHVKATEKARRRCARVSEAIILKIDADLNALSERDGAPLN